MNKKDIFRNYAIWGVFIVFYAAFYFLNNHAWVEEIPGVAQKPTPLLSHQPHNHPSPIADSPSSDTLSSALISQDPKPSMVESGLTGNSRTNQKSKPYSRGSNPSKWDHQPIEINRASVKEWQTLYNIGPYRAEKIVNFRTALGGFYNVEQVGETYALPDSVFRVIKPRLELKSTWNRIPINHRTYDSLYQHPYITKQMAYFIVRRRENRQPIRQMSELYELIQEKDHERLRKLEPYLDFSIK